MTRQIVIGPRARADIADIWRSTAMEHGYDAADGYVRELDQTMQMVREFPEIGVDSSDIRKGYRRIGSGSHLIYYTVRKTEICVVRVLHERMDARKRLR